VTWNPFDWTAVPFLTLYSSLAAIALLLGLRERSTIGPHARMTHQLGVFELAYLAGGARRLGDAILLSLTSGHGAIISAMDNTITVTDQSALAAHMRRPPLLGFQRNMTRQQFQTSVNPIVERVRARLRELGYAPTGGQMTSFRTNVLPFIALLVLFGIIKAVIGAERHHPIGILIFLLVATVFAGIALARTPSRTRAGKDALQSYQASNARAARAPLEHELLLAVALSGAVILSGTEHASVYAASKTMGGGDGGSGCGGGGGGGGCGGCSS
jgi:uncharacterized protein (TIGR04222 family)